MTTADTQAPPRAEPPKDPGRPGPRLRRVHPLRAELLRGIGPWAGAAVALVIGTVLYEKADPFTDWQTQWSEGAELLRSGTVLFGGSVTIAAGCWQGGRERRRKTLDLRASAARGRVRQTLVAVAPVVLWPIVAHFAGFLAVILATAPYASAGGPYVAVAVADSVAVAALGVIGFVVGRLVPWRAAPPLLGVGCWLFLVSYQGDTGAIQQGMSWLNPADQSPFDGLKPVWWYAPVSVLWTGGLAATVLLLYAARRRAVVIVPLTAAVLGATVLVQTGDGVWRTDPATTRLICDDGSPQICMEARNGGLRKQIRAALGEVHDTLRGVPGAPVRWVDIADSRLKKGEAQLPNPSMDVLRGRLTNPEAYARWAVDGMLGSCDTRLFKATRAEWAHAADIDFAIAQWLTPDPERWPWATPASRAHLTRLEAKSPADARDYLARRFAVDACTGPGKVPAP
ncbi:hypothetical protein ABZ714_31640 [Streptomyces sp. NPDC006798]|uniref:hypothetical protein n=1 Tax=Streptomyces sp. NPDC006798 TaxID=3155462 RepID=UPI00340635DF